MVMLLKASPARVIALAPHRSLVLLLTRSASTNSSAQNAPFAHPTSSTAPTVRARGIEAVIKYGPGGRSSVSGVLATVFGSTGFLGRYVVNRLAKLGSQVLLPYRGDEYDWRHMKLMGDLGQVNATYYNPRSLKEVSKMVEYSNVVINLIGRDFETSNFTYYDVHVTIPSLIAKAAKQAGVSRFIHVSCLGAAEDSPSRFLQAKWQGEQAVLSAFPEATIVRPAAIFGHEDRLLNRIAWLHFNKFIYGDPMVRGGSTKYYPVYVSDVAEGINKIMKDSETSGKIYELLGPTQYTYQDLLTIFSEATLRSINPTDYSPGVFNAFIKVVSFLPPKPVICAEDLVRMQLDEVPTGAPGFESLNIEPELLKNKQVELLRRYRSGTYYDQPVDMRKVLPEDL